MANVLESANEVVARLRNGEAVSITDWPLTCPVSWRHLGLAEVGRTLQWINQPDLLNQRLIQDELELDRLIIENLSESTNSILIEVAAKSIAHSHLVASEYQVYGRGRRGRSWISNFAENLAMSYGHRTQRPIAQLGGFSLVTGLAVVEALQKLGGQALGLKWPNDVVVEEAKIAGILVELVSNGDEVNAVIGIGVNVHCDEDVRKQIEQVVTDARSICIGANRTEITIAIIQTLQVFLSRFEQEGFEPFVEAFNLAHRFHGKTCNIHQGETIISGRVEGVDVDGALILSTDKGIRSFHGGEVSLRAI